VPQQKQRFTVDEYLLMEEQSAARHEFRHGQIIDTAGGTLEHGRIAAGLIREIGNRLKGKPCYPVGSDVRVKITGKPHYCYPDVTIVCGPVIFDPPDKRTTIVNPQVVIEVTSPSTAEDDRADKFYDYMRIDSLKEYLLVSQEKMRVDTFYRQDDRIWAIEPSFEGKETSVRFRSLGITVPLIDIYSEVELPAI
jgi:Uma2 family endonuclease